MDWSTGARGLTLSDGAWVALESHVAQQRQAEAVGGSYEYHDGAELDDPDEDVFEIWDDDLEEDEWDDDEDVEDDYLDSEDE